MLKLYKFRSLGDRESVERARTILETGEFWCSPLWEQNDPMEGVYTFDPSNQGNMVDVFAQKNRYKICSFSGPSALQDPTIWGYYANGFKGLAIEIEIPSDAVKKVAYRNGPQHWLNREAQSLDDDIARVITTKLIRWSRENEYRFLSDAPAGPQKIGRITGVYFGAPYGNVVNTDQIATNSPRLREYLDGRDALVKFSAQLGYSCFYSRIDKSDDTWTVRHENIEPPSIT